MEKHKQFLNFFQKAKADLRLLPSHMSLYVALYWSSQQDAKKDSFTVYRKDLMPLARIQSIATYHKCMKELNAFGYIIYKPSYDYYKGSQVVLSEIDNGL